MIKKTYVRGADLTEQMLADFKPRIRRDDGRSAGTRSNPACGNGFRMGILQLHRDADGREREGLDEALLPRRRRIGSRLRVERHKMRC